MYKTGKLKVNETLPLVLFIMFGLAFFLAGLMAVYENLLFPFNSRAAIGEVVQVDKCVHFRYQREDGSSVTAKSKYICASKSKQMSTEQWPLGRQVPIYYDLSEPTDIRLEQGNLLTIVLSFVAALLGAFVMSLGFWGWRSRKPKALSNSFGNLR